MRESMQCSAGMPFRFLSWTWIALDTVRESSSSVYAGSGRTLWAQRQQRALLHAMWSASQATWRFCSLCCLKQLPAVSQCLSPCPRSCWTRMPTRAITREGAGAPCHGQGTNSGAVGGACGSSHFEAGRGQHTSVKVAAFSRQDSHG